MPRILLAVLAAALFAATGVASATPCDGAVLVRDADPFRYQLRGDRCEGRYMQPVSGTTLGIVFFGSGTPVVTGAEGELTVRWQPAGRPVRLRVRSQEPRVYYRMDHLAPPSRSTYSWPPEVLAALQVPAVDLGAVAGVDVRLGGTSREALVPVVSDGSALRPLQVTLVPGQELDELYVTLIRLDGAGRRAERLRDGLPLGYGYYPAQRPVRLPLPELSAPGTYELELGALLDSGGADTVNLLLHLP